MGLQLSKQQKAVTELLLVYLATGGKMTHPLIHSCVVLPSAQALFSLGSGAYSPKKHFDVQGPVLKQEVCLGNKSSSKQLHSA